MKRTTETLADSWQRLAAEALTSMADWRVQHPRATLREIETAVEERLSALRARMRPARCPSQRGSTVEACVTGGAARLSPVWHAPGGPGHAPAPLANQRRT
jgi:hypothetical protein